MRKFLDKFEKRHFGLIIIVESLFILSLIFYIFNLKYTPALSNTEQANTFSEEISKDASVCLSLNPSDRPACAKIAGVKIKGMFPTTEERYKECMKFRPLYIRNCQDGLTEN